VFTGSVRGGKVAALGAGQVAGYGEPGASAFSRAGLLRAVEALEDAREVLRRNSGAGVRDGDLGLAVQCPPGEA
jgi:hypothetical protein